MSRKKIIAFLMASLLTVSSGSAIAAEGNASDTLDIEKTAIETIDNSVSVKSYSMQTEKTQNSYNDVQIAVQKVLAYGIPNVELMYTSITVESSLNQSINNEEVNTNSVRLDAYSKYISLLKANYAVNVQKELNDNLKKANSDAKLQLSNGLISKNDARLIEMNYLKSSYQLDSFEKNLDSAYMAVNLAMGEDISKRYAKLVDNNIVPDKKIKSLDDYIKAAKVNRAEIVNAENSLDAKKKKFAYDKATYMTDYLFYVQKTQYEIDRAENDIDTAKIDVELDINKGYRTLEEYMKAMENQQINYGLAKSNYESAKVQYDNGMITLSQLQEVEIAKAQAQISLKNAQLDAWLQQEKMDNATGIGPKLN